MMETEPDIQDTPEVIAKYGTAFEPKRENWEPIVGDIEFKNVSFQYKKGEKVLLKVKKEKINVFTKDGGTNLIRSDAYEKQ